MSRTYPKTRVRRRKVTGRMRRRNGDNKRTVRGDDARRMKKGIETAKRATNTTDVTLRVCITESDDTRQPRLSRVLIIYSQDNPVLPKSLLYRVDSLWPPTLALCLLGKASFSVASQPVLLSVWVPRIFNCLTIYLGYFFKSCRSGKNKAATTG